MKEKIYTIPINEHLNKECFCPFCSMHKSLEEEAVRYTVGPAMMEPDFRIITNEKGFCRKHMRELGAESKALPLSLVLDTHLDTVESILNTDLTSGKKSVFKKGNDAKAQFTAKLSRLSSSCAVCDRIENTFSRYFGTFVYMLKKEDGFLERVLNIDGFCMEHFSALAATAIDKMSDSDFEKLFVPIAELQKKRVKKYHEYIKNFSKSFDYRNAGKEIDAPKDIILKTGWLLNGEYEPGERRLDNI